ncbi:FAD-dependent monooxygenase [Arthrobacter zhangbolii]|uniref:FAD-dependent monooxygenase n=1 Tax=Arthrobacter zhangbolii TaxID=2886936 RepID=A0A9X1M5A5_9MICC|nr:MULTISPECIES: FAD-dependent monooxygenase [Arthrobacter]MCC3271659.1 FAD-dependent monooxygenase [Arthrobacter zhangbolii]MCC3293569.1 FAD-dependent monooxygenase [Arthrobacter zhangbolii]MDN3904727.1 FAD-dependent monooxygenase [Arthrobacter sp. YD2]UON93509.1 FAD-dependent monooxygenase [Arthrobacter zhangbolii]
MEISEFKDLHIAIVGGGYGGAAAAIALKSIGAENVHVYEQAPAFGQVGAGIGLRPTTVELFRQWGIFDRIAAVSAPSDHLRILSDDGAHLLAREEWPMLHGYAQTNHTRIIHRGDFIEALFGALPEQMVHTDHKLTSITDNGAQSTLTFENGRTVTADLVIAADGIRSLVRQQLFSAKPPVFAGEHAYRTVISIDDAFGLVTDDNPRFYVARNGTVAYTLPLRHRNEVSYDITTRSDDDSWAPVITNESLVAVLEGFDQRVIDVARTLDITKVTSRSVYDIDPVDVWHSESVTLLGDSAHAMLHHQGQGANSAIQDAGALADALLAADSIPAALEQFQAVRKPVTDELQRLSRLGWTPESAETAFPEQTPAR